MRAYLSKLLQDLRASYWFIPACMLVVAIGLSVLMTWLDSNYQASWMRDFQWLTAARTDGARSVLNVIAGSMIGVAGVTFSITIVAVSFASANFGPRLIANFMRDRGNQITLGTFIGTFVYCLLVLRTVRNASAPDIENSFQAFVPHFSVLMALVLALACVCVLIFFIHHIPESLNVGNIASKVSGRLVEGIDLLFPEGHPRQSETQVSELEWEKRSQRTHHIQIKTKDPGYIQALDVGTLVDVADEQKALIRVQYRPGDFISPDGIVIDVWSDTNLDDNARQKIENSFITGNERTAHQNVIFLVDQLVEIIARAMSPGVNDPFTAIACLNWLKVGLVHYIDRDTSVAFPDPTDRVRVYPVTFERFSSAIFDQSMSYTCTDRNTAMHVIGVLTELISYAEKESQKSILKTYLKRIGAAANSKIDSAAGGADVQARLKEALDMIDMPNGYEVHRQSQNWFGGKA